jgi:hypothetical protein
MEPECLLQYSQEIAIDPGFFTHDIPPHFATLLVDYWVKAKFFATNLMALIATPDFNLFMKIVPLNI